LAIVHRDLIIALAARHRLPAVFPGRFYVASGGLISYGPDLVDQFRRAAGYVDRILEGEKPAKYELVINLKTANVLGIEMLPRPRPWACAAPARGRLRYLHHLAIAEARSGHRVNANTHKAIRFISGTNARIVHHRLRPAR
jgi:hypothetical protein